LVLIKKPQKSLTGRGNLEMKKLFVVLVVMNFVLSLTGMSFAQSPSTTAQEKASDNASFNRGDAKPTAKPNADKMKAEKEKAAKEKGAQGKAAQGKVTKEKAAQEKAGKGKVQAEKGKTKQHVEDVKKQ
jgi:flagellar motor protein MotB